MKPINSLKALCLCAFVFILILASCRNDEPDTDTLPGAPLEIIISPLSPASRAADPRKSLWEPGDKVYIYVEFYDNNQLLPAKDIAIAEYTGTEWRFSKNIIPPTGFKEMIINASYIGNAPPNGQLVREADMLSCYLERQDITGIIALDNFTHEYSHITFKGLAGGDEVRFKNVTLYQINTDFSKNKLTNQTVSVTADAGGNATLYACIPRGKQTFDVISSGNTRTFVFDAGTGDTPGKYYIYDCIHGEVNIETDF